MNYKKRNLKIPPHEVIPFLEKHGYQENQWGTNKPIEFGYGDVVTAIKTFDGCVGVTIDVFLNEGLIEIDVYRFSGDKDMHRRVRGVRSYKEYIEELSEMFE